MLVDDHAVLRAGLRALLDAQPDMTVVAEAATTRGAAETALDRGAHVVLLDLTLPGGGSLSVIEQLRGSPHAPRVLVLSMHDDPSYARAALSAGAMGYVVMTISEADLLAAIRAVNRGRLFVDLDDEKRTLAVTREPGRSEPEHARLSVREREVLSLLGQGHGNQAVAEKLELSPKTVATYRARIAEKLGLRTTAEIVQYVARIGFHPNSPDVP
ncbi:MAG: response regulator transcription factor [Isosphaeraceae bacterium]